MAPPSEVIDWAEAMEQCGDDEEFLRELLADLRGEVDTKVAQIEEALRNPSPTTDTFHQVMRGAHVVKGAAANVMCQQMSTAAKYLEQAAAAANDLKGDAAASATSLANVQARYVEFRLAIDNFRSFLRSINV